jgi:general secretion pathway protein A
MAFMETQTTLNDNWSYLSTFGFHQNPFPVAPDDACFYRSNTIEEIIAEIVHGVEARKGFIMLTGEVGLGKTTISRRIISILGSNGVNTALVLHTNLQEIELLRAINRDFGIICKGEDGGMSAQVDSLNRFLLEKNRQGSNCAIVIDDAQNLSPKSLELVRMISNLESDQQKLVQIILVGQTELTTLLNTHPMRQLHSRIVIRKMVRSLTLEELRNYIDFKLNAAGNHGRIRISSSAYAKMHRLTKGNFRSVNMLMDRCLYALYCSAGQRITRKTVVLAWDDLYPDQRPASHRRLALAASILLPLAVAVGSWWMHLAISRDVNAATEPVPVYHKVPEALASLSPSTMTQAAFIHPSRPLVAMEARTVDPAVVDFLRIYQLEAYAEAFQQALKAGNLEPLARLIYSERGYQLIVLDTVPDRIRKHYGALTFTVSPGEPPTWLLFWRPRLQLKRFYYQYQGDEIVQLQRRFAELNLYQFDVDGIVGPRLMKAVVNFQKQQGLPVTGFPDPQTLFWIYHHPKGGAHG